MRLKNVLLVVRDLEASKKYYWQLFGLQPILEREGNVVLTEGLVLQEAAVWEQATGVSCLESAATAESEASDAAGTDDAAGSRASGITVPDGRQCGWKAEVSAQYLSSELYFEERNLESFIQKLEAYSGSVSYVTHPVELPSGRKIVRFFDPDGHLIEVGTP